MCHEGSPTLHWSTNPCNTNCESQPNADSELLLTPKIELPAKPYFQERLEKVFISTSVLMISELKDQWPANSGWKLYFTNYINNTINTTLKSVGLLRKLSIRLPRQIFHTIYKSFTRPLLDCGDVIYDLSLNDSLSNRIETVQYKAALAIAGAIQGSSRAKIYQDLRLD